MGCLSCTAVGAEVAIPVAALAAVRPGGSMAVLATEGAVGGPLAVALAVERSTTLANSGSVPWSSDADRAVFCGDAAAAGSAGSGSSEARRGCGKGRDGGCRVTAGGAVVGFIGPWLARLATAYGFTTAVYWAEWGTGCGLRRTGSGLRVGEAGGGKPVTKGTAYSGPSLSDLMGSLLMVASTCPGEWAGWSGLNVEGKHTSTHVNRVFFHSCPDKHSAQSSGYPMSGT